MSAHRTPERVAEYAQQARDRGIQVLIAAAGGSAALGGALAAWSTLPVIGIPLASSELKGIDALMSTAQMPPGIPVAAMAVGSWGGTQRRLLRRPNPGSSAPRNQASFMTTTGASSANGKLSPAFLTDFDDTAAVQNVAELLLNRFGDPTWTDVRQQFRDGKMNLKEYQEITFRNVRADRSAMQHFVKEYATLRPFFHELRQFCRANEIPLAVVSQGLDFYIEALLERDGFGDVPIYAVDTSFDQGRISYHYNHAYPGRESQGNSKALVVERFQQQGYFVVFAGDGASDQEGFPAGGHGVCPPDAGPVLRSGRHRIHALSGTSSPSCWRCVNSI